VHVQRFAIASRDKNVREGDLHFDSFDFDAPRVSGFIQARLYTRNTSYTTIALKRTLDHTVQGPSDALRGTRFSREFGSYTPSRPPSECMEGKVCNSK